MIKTVLAIRVELIMTGNTMIKSIRKANVVMDIELGEDWISALRRKNGASLVNKFPTQNIEVRAMTMLIDRRIHCLANRSHGKSIVVKKNMLVKG